MRHFSQNTAFQSYNIPVDNNSLGNETNSQFLLMSAETAIRRMLTSTNSTQTSDLSTTAPVNQTHLKTSEGYGWGNEDIETIVNLPLLNTPPKSRATLQALQEWEGYVVGIEDDEFIARLIDITAGEEYETEEATIPLEEISDYDRENLEIGSIFRWVIGYQRSPEGTRKRVSEIVFRDLPRVTESELKASEKWASEIMAEFTS